jgi:TP901 family phage tail tape measure protein
MSASAVRAGKTFVEISANDTDFQRGLKRVQHGVVRMGLIMKQLGSGMAIAGGVMGLPMLLAAQNASAFEDALLELKGSAKEVDASQLKRVSDEAIRLSRAMGVAPEKIAQSFTLLIKAGMTVEEALAGGARAAVEFSRVSGVETEQAAEFMKVAMNVFGVSATEAADTLSAAADSSETSIAAMVESFALVASVAKSTGQSLFGLSQGMAALARFGIKGEEAGTGLKTFLVKLLAPADDAKQALATLGISMGDLVDTTGTLLPLAQIAEVFADKLKGMGHEARAAMLANEALVKVFDVRGIRVINAFTLLGRDGFDDLADKMEISRTVAEKFRIAMSGISGAFEKLYSAVGRLTIAFMVGAAPALKLFASVAAPVMDFVSWLLTNVPVVSPILVTLAGSLLGVGLAALGAAGLLALLNFGLKGIIGMQASYAAAVGSMTLITGGFTKALIALRAAMFAIPGWGWALAAIAAAGGLAAWMLTTGSDPPSESSGIQRDQNRKPLGGDVVAEPVKNRSEGLGTFSALVAKQLGIGPALSAQERTAKNTGEMVDLMHQLIGDSENIANGQNTTSGVNGLFDLQDFLGGGPDAPIGSQSPAAPRNDATSIPLAATLQSGMEPPGLRGGVAARSDRDLVSASERSAIAAEESRNYLRQLVERSKTGGMAFA